MSNQLSKKWTDIERRRKWYELYGENAAILERARRDYRPPAASHTSDSKLLNKTYGVSQLNLPKPDTPEQSKVHNPYPIKKRNPSD